ncbi:MAG: hypothetical protein PHO42_05780 [Candidatus Omnitrophica bacterium]|nr:hypothetical protein [Candidatus Omnitrophota bacterium]
MPYDASMDQCLFSKNYESEIGRLTVGIYSYNNGPKKVQISRETRGGEGEFKFAKMGRLTKEELQALLPFLEEALKNLD